MEESEQGPGLGMSLKQLCCVCVWGCLAAMLTYQAAPREVPLEKRAPELGRVTRDRAVCTPRVQKAQGGPYQYRSQMPSVLAEVSSCPESFPCPPSGWWARPWYSGDAGRGPPHSLLRSLCPPLAFAMARLAAALWSLCVTTILVTSATQGRYWEGLGLQTQMGGWVI